ncbi:hypothetical protein N657DRAFT_613487 [Parathielavia appendiculata]|uniref:Acid phosphatase-like protein n=1 Tax=Parathielavia appendiculata TaxID=2587402 RepID=A0AAN6Z586_9PEZI|nr:hypothetical protein N657DRAFT_613487 [Parathielavia appendiculata]
MNTAGAVVLAIVLALIAAAAGWVIFTRVRASRLGLPPPPWRSYIPFLKSSSSSYGGPAPAPGGIIGWINDRIRIMRYGRNTRTAAGAYESSSSYNAGYSGTTGGNRGFDHLDDDPWDSRVGGYNPYEEERELGLAPPSGYEGHQQHAGFRPEGEGYQMNLPVDPAEEEPRGRKRSRSPGPSAKSNPFGDNAEPSNISLRGVSPRPMETSFAGRKAGKAEEDHDRRSIFREVM